jgi:hypothetical protein
MHNKQYGCLRYYYLLVDFSHGLCPPQLPFPIKLLNMLDDMANNGSQDIVSWQPHGKAFRVHQPQVFARTIMRSYFKQTHYKSFQRQLHIYGFRRIKKGKDIGGYYHSLFSRNQRSMSLRMTREKIKGTAGKNNGHEEEIEAPDFYKEMITMEDHPRSPKRDFATMAKPVPILADFSAGWVTAKNTYHSDGGRLLDPWLDLGEQQQRKVSSSSLKKKKEQDSCCNLQFFTGNVASVVVNKEHIEDGDEVFFEGKKFHFVGTSVPKTPVAGEDFLASVTARGPIGYMPKCA